MQTFNCTCGNTLYFENSQCLSCGQETGWCPACRSITALLRDSEGFYRCGNAACGHVLVKCFNYAQENVCNRCISADKATPGSASLCDCCKYNDTIPDLSVEGNKEKWARLEVAKRRLFFNLDLLGLPHGTEESALIRPSPSTSRRTLYPATNSGGPWVSRSAFTLVTPTARSP